MQQYTVLIYYIRHSDEFTFTAYFETLLQEI